MAPTDESTGPRILVVVDSWQGHTQHVARRVVEGIESENATALVLSADDATRADVLGCDALMMGSAVHQRGMTWRMKRFVDEVCEPAWFFDDLVGRVGAVFTAGGGHGQAGGGAESAQIDMLSNLAACGMILVPLPKCTPGYERGGGHWGPTIKTTTADMTPIAPDRLDDEAQLAFRHHGANVARVTRLLAGLRLSQGNRWPTADLRAQRAAQPSRPRTDAPPRGGPALERTQR
jgi:NAD(P)H dehydrogenase (quinone)